MKRDRLSHLAAVTFAQAEEQAKAKPDPAVLACCSLFMADCRGNNRPAPPFIERSQPPEKD